MWNLVLRSHHLFVSVSRLQRVPLRAFSTQIQDAYTKLLEEGKIVKDSNQSSVVYYLSRLENALRNYQRPMLPEYEIVKFLSNGGMQRVGLYKNKLEAEKDIKYFEAIEKEHEMYKLKAYLEPTVLSNAYHIRKKITEEYQVVPRLPTEVVPKSVLMRRTQMVEESNNAKVQKKQYTQEELLHFPRGTQYDWVRVPRGIYLYGNVGTGKSMLMDMFYNCVPIKGQKYRVHFHEFMQTIHQRIHQRNLEHKLPVGSFHSHLTSDNESIIQVSKEIAEQYTLICFDEFHVTDIADALILCHIFETLFKCGTVVVCTSNQSPELLYKGGLNRYYFLPFISLLQQHCRPIDIDSTIDYRRSTAYPVPDVILYPLGEATTSVLESLYPPLFKPNMSKTIHISSTRSLEVPSSYKGICKFSFEDLCNKERGIDDYTTICQNYHTLVLTDVPRFNLEKPSSLMRFVTLIDQLYDNKKRIILTAESNIDELFQPVFDLEKVYIDKAKKTNKTMEKGRLDSITSVAFSCRRTLSRLYEMTSKTYLDRHCQENSKYE